MDSIANPLAADLSPLGRAYLQTWPDGVTLVLVDDGNDTPAICGTLERDGDGAYLGCQTCRDEITVDQGGMCGLCRLDLAFADRVAAGAR